MKYNIFFRNLAVVAIMSMCMIALSSCRSHRTIEKKDVVILDDQETPLKPWVNCRTCDGKGTCTRCKGTGKVQGQRCVTCSGTGKCSVCAGEGGYRAD